MQRPEAAVQADELLHAHTLWWGEAALLRLDGELDIATAPLVDQAVAAVLARQPEILCLDLAGLVFCDMTGLHALRRLSDRVHAAHTSLHLVGLHPRLRYTLARLRSLSPWTPPVLQN
ncbi:STAS domain-containing protein [Streptomyces sp. NPDC056480]|uniref:STAS domain-containing protein n=1 Tax=Streptomyces sp. NPDC056480 TaxID=3345833 RepID=UPI0036B0A962